MNIGRAKIQFWFCFILLLSICFSSLSLADPEANKEETLKKYEQVIVRSNQMNVYGYDLGPVTFKLRRVTQMLVSNQFTQADPLLDDIKNDLRNIAAKGPEHLRREQRLVWIEIFGEFIQQVAIFVVISLFLLRFRFIRFAVTNPNSGFHRIWRHAVLFTTISIFAAFIGFVRYGQSSWSFIDLEIVFIGLSGLVGGIWVGLFTGVINALFRFLVVPNFNFFSILPVAVGVIAGCYRFARKPRKLNQIDVLLVGFLVGLIHSLFMYLPIYNYLPLKSFMGSVLFLSFSECIIVYIFFAIAWQILKEEKAKETEKELMRAQIQFLQAQINPHFLFNALNTIAAVCGEEGAKRARELIMQLSTFFRRITKRESDFVSLKDELEYIDSYLNIELVRFGKRLNIEKHIELSEKGLETPVPVLILQPIVENAIKHGISKKTEGGKLILSAREEDSKILVEIKDTGVGMTEEARLRLLKGQRSEGANGNHTGVGFYNIRERLIRYYGNQSKIMVESVQNQGTQVKVELPAKLTASK